MDDAEADAANQAEEIDVLATIYTDAGEMVAVGFDDGAGAARYVEFALTGSSLLLRCHLPQGYPSREPPVLELLPLRDGGGSVPGAAGLESSLLDMFTPGEPILFAWVEHLKGFRGSASDGDAVAAAEAVAPAPGVAEDGGYLAAVEPLDWDAHEQVGGGAAAQAPSTELGVFHGEPLTEKRSVFQAHAARCASREDALRFVALLREDRRVARATHNIMAYRITSGAVVYRDVDDDGETAAGGRLGMLLELMQAENVCVVVSRWYGGILLGPSRFGLIQNAARLLLERLGWCRPSAAAARRVVSSRR